MKRLSMTELKAKADGMELDEAVKWLGSLSGEYGETVSKLADKYYRRLEAKRKEIKRLTEMMLMEEEAYQGGYRYIGGVDEAGRGPLAGPVVAACVILPRGSLILSLNDSKKLSARRRDQLYDEIRQKAVAYGIGIAESTYIDEVNILNATKKAMVTAILSMKQRPDFLIIDAVRLKFDIEQKSVPKADENSASVAAASILAKVTRDRIMKKMDSVYPGYGFLSHKGYGTQEHIEAIRNMGLCPIHRRSFTKNFVSENP